MEVALYIIGGLYLFVGFLYYSSMPSGAWASKRDFAQGWVLAGIVIYYVVTLLVRLVMWLIGK